MAVSLAAVLAYQLLVSLLPEPVQPTLVRDDAKLLAPVERRKLAEFHRYLLSDHDVDYRVVTAAGAGDLSRFAVQTFEELDVGGQSRGQRGLLLVIDPAADRVRLEVGRALEGSFPDAFVAYVEERQMVPFFRSARVSDGVLATTELIVQRIQGEKQSGGFQDHIAAEGTAGGGAETAAQIGKGAEDAGKTDQPASPAAAPQGATASPRAVVDAYLEAMAKRNADPDLPIYTPETRRMLRDWTVTPAQMDSVARTYRRCAVDRVLTSGKFAVVRYGVQDRACAPFFLRREGGGWRLDLTMMQTAVRFGRNNAWRLDPAASHPYGFAFSDWRFDSNGFPVGAR
ncbi:MAG: TPM domain-containing protein [Rhodovibrionaceae bacterium]|nr:TPM domain-containing protein [Rhodovibrionaceae bacterium]